jgi:hypothetical protein
MSRVTQAGKYRGRITSSTIQIKKDGEVVSSAAFVASLEVYERFRTGEKNWEPLQEPQNITAFMNLIKNDGSRNEVQWNSLMQALGWNGDPRLMLASDRWAGKEVECTIEQSEYKGKISYKVAWINEVGGGGAKEATVDEKDLFIQMCIRAGVTIPTTPVPPTHTEAPPSQNILDVPEESIPF